MKHTDVCIIGAGPAGIFTSLFLSKYDIPHTLIEQSPFPRAKTCGDGITVEVLHSLNQLSPAWTDELMSRGDVLPCWDVDFVSHAGYKHRLSFDRSRLKYPPFITMERKNLDGYLFDKVDRGMANVLQPVKVEGISNLPRTLLLKLAYGQVTNEMECKILVLASGNSALLSRQGIANPDFPFYSAITGYARPTKDGWPSDPLFYFHNDLLPGYFWAFPMSGGLVNIGLGMVNHKMLQQKVNLKKKLIALVENNQIINKALGTIDIDTIRFAGERLFFNPGRKRGYLAGNHFLITGDAGALADPFLGKGIGPAVISGRIAATAIRDAVNQNCYDNRALSFYHQKLKSMYRYENMINRSLYFWFSDKRRAGVLSWFISRKPVSKMMNHYINKRLALWLHP